MRKPKISSNGRTITVRVPIAIRKRGGRKVVLAPDGFHREPSCSGPQPVLPMCRRGRGVRSGCGVETAWP